MAVIFLSLEPLKLNMKGVEKGRAIQTKNPSYLHPSKMPITMQCCKNFKLPWSSA